MIPIGKVYRICPGKSKGTYPPPLSGAVFLLKASCHDLLHLPAETEKDALFEPGYVALRNTHAVGDLLLRILPPPEQPETQGDDVPVALAELCHGLVQRAAV